MADDPRHVLGRRAETMACRELRRRGYHIVERNWRCRLGEIDIIARHGEDLVIVEVKARVGEDFGAPERAVDHAKRHRLSRLLTAYRQATDQWDVNCRFDIVALLFEPRGTLVRCDVFADAFEMS